MELSDGFDFAGYSILRSSENTMAGVGTLMLKKTLDLQESQGNEMVRLMEQSVNPRLGRNIDIRI